MYACMYIYIYIYIHTYIHLYTHTYVTIPLYCTTSAILDRWSNIANRQWSNIPEPSVDLQRCGSFECDIFSANFVYNVLAGSTAVVWYSNIDSR